MCGFFLVGEGVGYVGGIMSVGVDGIEVVEVLVVDLLGLLDVLVL